MTENKVPNLYDYLSKLKDEIADHDFKLPAPEALYMPRTLAEAFIDAQPKQEYTITALSVHCVHLYTAEVIFTVHRAELERIYPRFDFADRGIGETCYVSGITRSVYAAFDMTAFARNVPIVILMDEIKFRLENHAQTSKHARTDKLYQFGGWLEE